MSKVLDRSFYARSPVVVAKGLIGKLLVRRLDDGTLLKGIIVETEAYGGAQDPASHAYHGITRRNQVMFGEAGHAYVYFTYGFHHCLNFVTGKKGIASAVLIRALEPTKGFRKMQRLRKTTDAFDLASGPGKLCQALSINLKLNGIDVTAADSPICVNETSSKVNVKSSTRIGITSGTEKRWRFFEEGNKNLSKLGKTS